MPLATIEGLRHYFRLEGQPDRERLVLIHALGTDSSLWDPVVQHLASSFQILRYDLRGHGGSDVSRQPYAVDDLARDLLELTEGIGWSRFAVCGVSVGALVAMSAALQRADRVMRLILVSAAARIPEPPEGWPARARAALDGGMGALADPMIARMFSEKYRDCAASHLGTVKSVLSLMDPRGYADCVAAIAATDFGTRPNSIDSPTIVVRGIEDRLIPRAAAESLALSIPDGCFVEVPGAHFPFIESANEFCGALDPRQSTHRRLA